MLFCLCTCMQLSSLNAALTAECLYLACGESVVLSTPYNLLFQSKMNPSIKKYIYVSYHSLRQTPSQSLLSIFVPFWALIAVIGFKGNHFYEINSSFHLILYAVKSFSGDLSIKVLLRGQLAVSIVEFISVWRRPDEGRTGRLT